MGTTLSPVDALTIVGGDSIEKMLKLPAENYEIMWGDDPSGATERTPVTLQVRIGSSEVPMEIPVYVGGVVPRSRDGHSWEVYGELPDQLLETLPYLERLRVCKFTYNDYPHGVPRGTLTPSDHLD